jgi:hypothetical protein
MPSRFGRTSDFLLAMCTIALALAISGISARSAGVDLGCEGVKIEVNVDALTLEQYQAVVKEHRCKCLKMQSECVSSPAASTPATSPPNASPVPPVANPAPPPNIVPKPAPVNTRNFTLYDGRDVAGSDYRTITQDTSQDACIEQCKQDNRCVAFSWDRWNNYCFLKQAVPGLARIDPQSMAAVASGERQPSDSNAPLAIERFYNTEFRDKPYATTKDGSYGDCEHTCRTDSRCEVFTYQTQAKLCNLIRRPYQYYRLGKKGEHHAVDECNSHGLPVCSGVKRQSAQ